MSKDPRKRAAALLERARQRVPVTLDTQGEGTPLGGNLAAVEAIPGRVSRSTNAVSMIATLREEAGYGASKEGQTAA